MNVTFVTGSEISFGNGFDAAFDNFCRREYMPEGDEYGGNLRVYAERLYKTIDENEGPYTFSDFGKFIDGFLAEPENNPGRSFFDFVENFLVNMLKAYYAKEPNLRQEYRNTRKEFMNGTEEWFRMSYKTSLAGLFSKAVFSEVSYRHFRDECTYYMSPKEGDNDNKGTSFNAPDLVLKDINYKIFNFNYGDLLWKCICSHVVKEGPFDDFDWTKAHEMTAAPSTTRRTVVHGDFTFEDYSVYFHGDEEGLSARTDAGQESPLDSLMKAISESHVICAYGLPTEGPAYEKIWREIFKRLKSDHVTLVIFDFCDDYDSKVMTYKRRRTNHYMSLLSGFVDAADGKEDIWNYKDKIHIAYNKDIFSLDWYFVISRDWGWIYDDDMLGRKIIRPGKT